MFKNDKKYAFIAEKYTFIDKNEKSWKKFKKGIDKQYLKWYNAQVASREWGEKHGRCGENRKNLKKLEKKLKKFWKRYWQTQNKVL